MGRARLRTRAKRSAYLLLALVLLLLLLELNQWLPGTWPGGGGGGFRAAGQAGLPDPLAGAAHAAPPAEGPRTPEAVVPPTTAPGEWPREGVTVEVRGPDGARAEGWRLGVGEGGAEDGRPLQDGTLRARDKRIVAEGFRVRSAAGVLRHRRGLEQPGTLWTVHLPDGELPVRRTPGPRTLQVRGDGRPLAGARVQWTAGGQPHDALTDAAGRVELQGTRDGEPIEVAVRAEGHLPATHLLEQHDPRDAVVDLDRRVTWSAHYASSPATVLAASLRSGDGSVLARGTVGSRGPEGQRVDFQVAASALEGAWLETRVGTREGPFVFRRPLRAVADPLPIPAWRKLSVRLRDVQGARVDAPPLHAELATYAGADAEDEPRDTPLEQDRTALPGGLGQPEVHEAGFVVAAGTRTRLWLEPPGAAPIARTLTDVDGSDVLEFTVEPGLQVPVQVLGADGRPLAGAEVLARAAVEGVRLLRRATTDAGGRAFLGPLRAGPLELFARAAGHAPAAQPVDATSAMGTVVLRLAAGYPLRLAVADPYGRPLAGVNVELAGRRAGATVSLTALPEEPPHVTGADGVLTLEGLPEGSYDVSLTLEGYGPQKLRGVRPGAVTHFATLLAR